MNNDTPAFPVNGSAWNPLSGEYSPEAGMTLRDWFAGQALAMSEHDTPKNLAVWAYMVADAMLAAKAMSARQSQDPEGLGPKDASAVPQGFASKINGEHP